MRFAGAVVSLTSSLTVYGWRPHLHAHGRLVERHGQMREAAAAAKTSEEDQREKTMVGERERKRKGNGCGEEKAEFGRKAMCALGAVALSSEGGGRSLSWHANPSANRRRTSKKSSRLTKVISYSLRVGRA